MNTTLYRGMIVIATAGLLVLGASCGSSNKNSNTTTTNTTNTTTNTVTNSNTTGTFQTGPVSQ